MPEETVEIDPNRRRVYTARGRFLREEIRCTACKEFHPSNEIVRIGCNGDPYCEADAAGLFER